MRKHLATFGFALLLVFGMGVLPAFAQTSVKGVCKDVEGKPIAGGTVIFTNQDNGQKFAIKTDKKGEYFSLGVTPGKYKVSLYKNDDDAKADKPMFFVNGFPVVTGENTVDFDLKKEQEKQAQGQGLSPEQLKQQQEAAEKAKKENATIKTLNDKITAATTSMKAGDFDAAVATMTEATQLDPSRDVLWGILADAYRGSANKETDRAEKQKRLDEAVADYNKAIDLKQKAMEADAKKNPDDPKRLAGYYNNLGDAAAKDGKIDDAIKAYDQAAKVNPEMAAAYYFNEGAVLTNAGKVDEANAAFDKCIAADPTKAEAYYQKGVNLMGKATLQGDKTIPAPGTIEAFQKYLELAPNGPNAQNAKDLMASLGATVQTSYGTKKKTK
jgi:tetratricopeptide (TPR) repeat protein